MGRTPRAVADQCSIILTSLPGPPEIEAVAMDNETGLIGGIQEGSVYFDLSTNSPTLIRRIHTEFLKRGAHVLDAPVSGGPKGAASGKFAIWVGGDNAVFEANRACLDAIGDQVIYIGEIGAGAISKLVHNSAGYAIQAAIAEVFTAGVKAGVEPLALWDAIRQGARGAKDTSVLPEMAKHHVKMAPHVNYRSWPEVGHAPFYEDAKRFNTELASFEAKCFAMH